MGKNIDPFLAIFIFCPTKNLTAATPLGGVGWQAFVANGSASFGDGRTIVFQAGQSARMQTGFSQNKCTFWNAPV